MARFAPSIPTNNELNQLFPQTSETMTQITDMRARASEAIGGRSAKLLVVLGPCSITSEDQPTIQSEGEQLARLTATNPNVLALHRIPPWKPRTRPEDWHGLETTDPEAAYSITSQSAAANSNVAIEIGDPRHLKRYGSLTTLAWKGGRNTDPSHTEALANYDPTLPVAVKNSLDGEIDAALQDVETIGKIRANPDAAILLFRGGANATTPEAWEEQYLLAHERTHGRLLVDVAHGGEQAHDPDKNFGKSVMGQVACMNHLIQLAEEGTAPLGVFAEASDIPKSQTDPVMPFEQALQGAVRLAELREEIRTIHTQ